MSLLFISLSLHFCCKNFNGIYGFIFIIPRYNFFYTANTLTTTLQQTSLNTDWSMFDGKFKFKSNKKVIKTAKITFSIRIFKAQCVKEPTETLITALQDLQPYNTLSCTISKYY